VIDTGLVEQRVAALGHIGHRGPESVGPVWPAAEEQKSGEEEGSSELPGLAERRKWRRPNSLQAAAAHGIGWKLAGNHILVFWRFFEFGI